MPMTYRGRTLSDEEVEELARMARSRTLAAGLVRRAQIVQHAADGLSAPGIAAKMSLCGATVRFWLKRFTERGLGGLEGGHALEAFADLHRRGAEVAPR
jgi:DNA-binding NarL/FixJ family response regulator